MLKLILIIAIIIATIFLYKSYVEVNVNHNHSHIQLSKNPSSWQIKKNGKNLFPNVKLQIESDTL